MSKRWWSMLALAAVAMLAGAVSPAAAANRAELVALPGTVLIVMPGPISPPAALATTVPRRPSAALLPAGFGELIAKENAALARLAAETEAFAAAPPQILATALPAGAPGGVKGVVMTSLTTTAGNCRETIAYSYPPDGGAPRVAVRRTGNACTAVRVPRTPQPGPQFLETAAPQDRLIPPARVPRLHFVSSEQQR